MSDQPEFSFPAIVYKVQTIATDNGIRLTLDLPESAIPQMAMLAECKRDGIPLFFTAKVDRSVLQETSESGKVSTGSERKSSRATP